MKNPKYPLLAGWLPARSVRSSARLGSVDTKSTFFPGLTRLKVIALALLVLFSTAVSAEPPASVCNVPESDTAYVGKETVGFFASKIPVWRVRVNGMENVRFGTQTLNVDYPSKASRLRFFYVREPAESDYGFAPMVGCLYTSVGGEQRTFAGTFDMLGNSSAEVAAVFTLQLGHGVGNALFIILSWEIDNPGVAESGYSYSVYAYGGKGTSDRTGLERFELIDLEDKAFGLAGGVVGVQDNGKKLTYPYTDEASVVKRLRAMGYLK